MGCNLLNMTYIFLSERNILLWNHNIREKHTSRTKTTGSTNGLLTSDELVELISSQYW